jgi:N-acetylglucosaminyldiphosphoundecaprenol N-acetyl-beta-D-mannosaminyltransferase
MHDNALEESSEALPIDHRFRKQQLDVAVLDESSRSGNLLGAVSIPIARSGTETGLRQSTRSATVAGMRIDALDFDGVVEAVLRHASSQGESSYVVTPNAHHVMLFQNDALFRNIYEQAFLVVPDGVPLLWAARILGQELPGRVNGTDLFQALCARAAVRGLRVYFLGGREGAAAAAAERLRGRHPSLDVCGIYSPPFGFERDAAESEKILRQINEAAPDLLFVGLGAPKQEYWMCANRELLGVPVSLGIGVSFEFVGGLVQRAPALMQRWGLEWLFRLISEPRRLWKRYVVGNTLFCFLVLRQLLEERRAGKVAAVITSRDTR